MINNVIDLILNKIAEQRKQDLIINNRLINHLKMLDGGKGSGFFGHKGRPGMVGGSSSTGGGKVLKNKLENSLILDMRKDERLISKYGNMSKFLSSISLGNWDITTRVNRVIETGKGIFSSREERDKADELLLDMEKNGLTDSKEYKDLKRKTMQDDYLCDLYELLEDKYGLPEKDYTSDNSDINKEEGKDKEEGNKEDKKTDSDKAIEEANKESDINKPLKEDTINISFQSTEGDKNIIASAVLFNIFNKDFLPVPFRNTMYSDLEVWDDITLNRNISDLLNNPKGRPEDIANALKSKLENSLGNKTDYILSEEDLEDLQTINLLKVIQEVDYMKTDKFRTSLENFINNQKIQEERKTSLWNYLKTNYLDDLNNSEKYEDIIANLFKSRLSDEALKEKTNNQILVDLQKGDFTSILNRVDESWRFVDTLNIPTISSSEDIKATYYKDSSEELYKDILNNLREVDINATYWISGSEELKKNAGKISENLLNSDFIDFAKKNYKIDKEDINNEKFELGIYMLLESGGKLTSTASNDNIKKDLAKIKSGKVNSYYLAEVYRDAVKSYLSSKESSEKGAIKNILGMEPKYYYNNYKAYKLHHNKKLKDKVYNDTKKEIDADIKDGKVKETFFNYSEDKIFNSSLVDELEKYDTYKNEDELKEVAGRNYKEAIDKLNSLSATGKETASDIIAISDDYIKPYRQAVISKAILNNGSKLLDGNIIYGNRKTKSGRIKSEYESVVSKADIDTNIISSKAINDIDTNYTNNTKEAAERITKIIPTLKAKNLYNNVDETTIETYKVKNHGSLSPNSNEEWSSYIKKSEQVLGSYLVTEGARNDISKTIHNTVEENKNLKAYLNKYQIDNPNKLTDSEARMLFHLMTNGGQSYDSIKTGNTGGIGNFVRLVAASAPKYDGVVYRAENMDNLDRDWDNIKVGDSISMDGYHFTYSETFMYEGFNTPKGQVPSAISMFGEGKPAVIKITGGVPFFNMEPYARKTKMNEHEGLIAGFLKVKSIKSTFVDVKVGFNGTKTQRIKFKEYEMEYDWDRLKEYLKLNAKVFADKYGLYKD